MTARKDPLLGDHVDYDVFTERLAICDEQFKTAAVEACDSTYMALSWFRSMSLPYTAHDVIELGKAITAQLNHHAGREKAYEMASRIADRVTGLGEDDDA